MYFNQILQSITLSLYAKKKYYEQQISDFFYAELLDCLQELTEKFNAKHNYAHFEHPDHGKCQTPMQLRGNRPIAYLLAYL